MPRLRGFWETADFWSPEARSECGHTGLQDCMFSGLNPRAQRAVSLHQGGSGWLSSRKTPFQRPHHGPLQGSCNSAT